MPPSRSGLCLLLVLFTHKVKIGHGFFDAQRAGSGHRLSSFQKILLRTHLVYKPGFSDDLRVQTTFAMSCRCPRTLSSELIHARVIPPDPGRSVVRILRTPCGPSSQFNKRPAHHVCLLPAKSGRAVAALLAYTGGYSSFKALQYHCTRESA